MISVLIVFITVYKFEEKKLKVEIENTNLWVVVVFKLQGKYENTIIFLSSQISGMCCIKDGVQLVPT